LNSAGLIRFTNGTASGAATSGAVVIDGGVGIGGALNITGTIKTASQLISTVAIGTAPLVITSTTVVPNLNVSALSGAALDITALDIASDVKIPTSKAVADYILTGPNIGTGATEYMAGNTAIPQGTVTSIATSQSITGGTITGSGTIGHLTTTGHMHVPAGGLLNKILT